MADEIRDESARATSGPPPKARAEPPPFGGTWARLYAVVLGELALLVILFTIFTRAFE